MLQSGVSVVLEIFCVQANTENVMLGCVTVNSLRIIVSCCECNPVNMT